MNTSAVNQMAQAVASQGNTAVKASGSSKVTKSSQYGSVIGKPELSKKAAEYYDQLKDKFNDMDFILVSKDKKDEVETNPGRYGQPNKTIVLIDEEKIEKMATDEKEREKYEGILTNARTQIAQMKSELGENEGVSSFGIKINDNGTASYFAVIDKSMALQKERIEKKAEQKAEDKKAAAKQAQKDKTQKQIEKLKENNKASKPENTDKTAQKDDTEKTQKGEYVKNSNLVTVTASSVDELLKKISDIYMDSRSDSVMTEAEKMVGQHFDMNV